jgi:DNA-binding MarR family transcriptional regulator
LLVVSRKDPRLEKLELLGLFSKSSVRAKIAIMLYEKPRRSRELENIEGSSPASIHRILEELEGRGLVARRKTGQQVVWELTPRAIDLLKGVIGAGAPAQPASSPLRGLASRARSLALLASLAVGVLLVVLSSSRGLASGRVDWVIGGLVVGLPVIVYSLVAYSRSQKRA